MRLGPYVVGERLGAGGMGVVHRARDERLQRDVAIKLLPERDPDKLRRFATEAKAAAALSHPNVLAVFDVSIDGEQPYLVTELLSGKTLAELIADGPVPVDKALALGAQIARGLAAAHERNIIHRDLKPSNLFVGKDGVVKILDFGLAKVMQPTSPYAETHDSGGTQTAHTVEGAILGTVGYMAPEQVQGRPADARSDLFALGCVLQEMLTGKRAFDGPTPVETSYQILRGGPAPLDGVPAPVARIVERLLQKDPAERFQSARDLAFALETLDARAPAQGATKRRIPRWWLALPVVAAGLLAGGLLAKRTNPPSTPRFQRVTFRGGAVGAAAFTPDGKSVIFDDFMQGEGSLALGALGATETRTLLAGADFLAVSSKGTLAVLQNARMSNHPWNHRGTLALASLAGAAPRAIADDILDAWFAPDSEELAVIRAVGEREQLEFPIGTVRHVSHGCLSAPRPGRDGKLAFIEYEVVGHNDGRVTVLDERGPRALSPYTAMSLGLAWAPDERELWYTASPAQPRRELWAVTLAGANRLLVSAPADLGIRDVAPDGRVLIAGGSRRFLVRAHPADGPERHLTVGDYAGLVAMTPDGRSVVFRAGTLDAGHDALDVYLAQIDGTAPPVRVGHGYPWAITANGAALLWSPELPATKLSLMPTGVGRERALPAGAIARYHWALFFPDDKRVLIVGVRSDQQAALFVQELEGGEPRPVDLAGVKLSPHERPLLSADGATIFFFDDAHRLLRVPATGGRPEPIAATQGVTELIGLAADGRVYLQRTQEMNKPSQIDLVDPRDGRSEPWRELRPPDDGSGWRVNTVVVSADGRSWVYGYVSSRNDLYVLDGAR
jgi:hypothetical protein